MATDKEYQALIKALSGECERLHKAIESIRAEIADRPSFMLTTSEEYEKGVNAMLNQALRVIDKYRRTNDRY